MNLPQIFINEGLKLANGMTIFGKPMETLTREELLAVAAQGWKSYHRAIDEQRSIDQFGAFLHQAAARGTS